MKLMMAMMGLIPRILTDRISAPMIEKARVKEGNLNPVDIEMNLTNLLICGAHCGTCPSKPQAKGEALFCASGRSKKEIEENGCNCIMCPLFEKCGYDSKGYFCKYGAASSKDIDDIDGVLGESNAYLKRFIFKEDSIESISADSKQAPEEEGEPTDVVLNFLGDRKVMTMSRTKILQASLDAGIPHTHVCGGNARCSTCRVNVVEGLDNCRPRNKKELHLAKVKGFSPNVRLACQTTAKGDLTLRRLVLDESDISHAIMQGRSTIGQVGREVHATLLFSDIRSFTSFSENHLPYDIIHILNRYFGTFGEHIDEHGGYIDKYMGDGIMAIFGLDEEFKENSTLLATKAAIAMLKSLNEFNQYLANHFSHQFNIGIGIHTGNVIVGNLGFHKKMEFTAIGDTVNTASRIESLNKKAKTSLLLSEEAYAEVKNDFKWRRKFRSKVKGKEQPVIVYEPFYK